MNSGSEALLHIDKVVREQHIEWRDRDHILGLWDSKSKSSGHESSNGRNELVDIILGVCKVLKSTPITSRDTYKLHEAVFGFLVAIINEFEAQDDLSSMVMSALEEVNDIYDQALVALEDDNDGSVSGNCRVFMLGLLAYCFGHESLKGHHLLELASGSLSSVVSMLAYVLRCDSGVADFKLQSTASRCLVELSYPECVFCNNDNEVDGNSTDIKKLTKKFNAHVSELICSVIEYDVVDSFGRCVCQHQHSHSNTDVLMKDFMTLIHNCLLYCMFVEAGSTVGVKSIEWFNLTSAMQTLAIATFNVKTFRRPLQQSELLSRIAELRQMKEAPSTLVILMKVAINCDYGSSRYWEAFTTASSAAFESMDETLQRRVRHRVQVGSDALPVNPSSNTVPMVYALLGVEVSGPIDSDSPEENGSSINQKKNGAWLTRVRRPSDDYKRSRRRGRRRWRRGNPFKRVSRVTDVEGIEDDDGEGELEADQLASAPDDERKDHSEEFTRYCALTGCLMRDPVKTPQGVLFERAAILDWLSSGNTGCPVTGCELSASDLVAAPEVLESIVGCQAEELADLENFQESPGREADVGTIPSSGTEAENPSGSLLGDLPALNITKPQGSTNGDSEKPKQAVRIRRTSPKLVDAPAELKCSLDGKIMTNPMRSPYGHVFEKKTLEKWFDSCGEICPITDKPLCMDDCKPAHDMKKAIVRYVKEKEECHFS
ncbi:hypothetical protein FOL47_002342 [Perkinsus chesapeaki]|uniref:U-box domain-containing protein n=1 Tax=Perkinsus chesapeaki TaxID=330153 RepID=A0A7J6MEI0_PERCH|nr:hypothetical protein FOL47_002342 [Perkinsus chesapeaki]